MRCPSTLALVVLALSGVPAGASAQSGQERIQWRFDMASAVSGSEVSVGPDGTIYTADNLNFYARNPDGTERWTVGGLVTGLGAGASIDFLADGTILTGTDSSVVALHPDGTTRWEFPFDISQINTHLEVGPSVGPDGNIYAVAGAGGLLTGLGAFSLTPDGSLRWSDTGSPPLSPINSSTGGPVFFTQDRLIFPFRIVGSGANRVYGYDFQGKQTLYVDFTCTGIPRTDSLNRVLIASACGIEALEEDGNQSFWTVNFGAVNLAPALGADATAYAAQWFGDVNAINPDGSIRWTSSTATDAFRMLAARQDVGRLVYSGAVSFGVPDFVSGVDTADGALLWTVDLRTVNGHNEGVWTQLAPTSADGSVAYFTTRFTSNGEPGALYAVRIGDTVPTGAETGPLPAASATRLLRVSPNPSPGGRLSIDFQLAGAPTELDLAIYDVAGRRLRTLFRGASPRVPGRVAWDGRDGTGTPVASGSYFARITGESGVSDVRRITVLR